MIYVSFNILFLMMKNTYEPRHEISKNVVCATSKVSDQSAHMRSPDQSLCESLEYSMTVKLLTVQHLEFLSLTVGCVGLSESTLVKLTQCWKSHVVAQILWHVRLSCSKVDVPVLVVALEIVVS